MSVSILHGPGAHLVGTVFEPCEAEMPVPIFHSSSVFFRSLKLLVVSLFIESSGCFTVL